MVVQVEWSDFQHEEEEVKRKPYSIHTWWNYIRAIQLHPSTSTISIRLAIYERALHVLPRSYKLWKAYLDTFYETHVRGQCIDHVQYEDMITLYERALIQLHTMPRLWIGYLHLLQDMKRISMTRRVFDRALRALPITQHYRLWPNMIDYMKTIGTVPHSVKVLYRRYIQLEPSIREDYIEYLIMTEQYQDATEQLIQLIMLQQQVPPKVSNITKTVHALWMQLCTIVSQHSSSIGSHIDVNAILRSGIAQFTNEVGRLWCSLATYYVRLGSFDNARNVYEEAIETVVTVRDFSMIFDAYVQFIEGMVTTTMEMGEKNGLDVERWLQIYEEIADRRPLLLNSVLLRQNPNNIKEWEKRIQLMMVQDPSGQQVITTYANAVKTVDPMKSGGQFHVLWIGFAHFYETHERLADARAIFKRAIQHVSFRTEEELAAIYCAWTDMEIRLEAFDEALNVIRQACSVPDGFEIKVRTKATLRAKDKVHLNVRVWNLRLDLEESLGDGVASTRIAYDQAFELKVVTTAMVINYASYLEENRFYEESFRVYERGLAIFPTFPHASTLWNTYLTKFVARYKGTKVERARDLHEQAIQGAPPEFAKDLYLKYAQFEEQYGMLRNVMTVMDRATRAVPESEQLDVYKLYVKKAHEFFGVAKVRDVYQQGIATLADPQVPTLCLEFAKLETTLGEYERARVLYAHASQFCDPRKYEERFWVVWHDFEVKHGSEHTFLEMLRIKRSVVAQYATVNYIAEPDEDQVTRSEASSAVKSGDAMAALEATVVEEEKDSAQTLKRPLTSINEEEQKRQVRQKVVEVKNDEEIDLDDE